MSKALHFAPPQPINFLPALPTDEYRRLAPSLKPFSLVLGEVIYETGDLIRRVYFPTSGIISLLANVAEGGTLEVGIVGREGLVGMPVFMGVKTSPNHAVVQGAGSALTLTAAALRTSTSDGQLLPRLLQRYAYSLWSQLSQSAVCNQNHSIDARLARWLLMTRDRMGSDEFQLTQEFLSNMLGVRREGRKQGRRRSSKTECDPLQSRHSHNS
jgi:CRP-like cAMP-binding protein